jgi:hypothetical protein
MDGLGLAAAGILAALGSIHIYWAAGGRRGVALAIPQRDGRPLFAPPPSATLLVAVLLFVAALLVAGAVAGWAAPLPAWVYRRGSAAVGVVFLLRALGDFRLVGLFKRVRDTPFARWDTLLFSPLCAVLGVLILLALRR